MEANVTIPISINFKDLTSFALLNLSDICPAVAENISKGSINKPVDRFDCQVSSDIDVIFKLKNINKEFLKKLSLKAPKHWTKKICKKLFF